MLVAEQVFERLRRADPTYYTEEICQELTAKLNVIIELKEARNAVIIAHNYQRPEVFEVADFVGDSFALALQSAEVEYADVIVFCGVHFMAETAKIVNPNRKVLLPNLQAGCSLADMADAFDVEIRIKELKKEFPDLSVVTYVNTTAAVKALSDVCCTSANAVEVVRALDSNNILFIPDQNLAKYVASQVPEKNIIPWDGYCYVHHELQADNIREIKLAYPNIKVVVHPECREDLVNIADAVLSTSQMIKYAQDTEASEFLAVTECGLSDLLSINVPNKHFLRACKICKYMKMITLDDMIHCLENLEPEITLSEDVRLGAERALKRMFQYTKGAVMPMVFR